MEHVFAPAAPYLRWSEMETSSQIDEQKGYHRLYSGAMLGIRNPTTHEFGWIDEPELALELIVFAQHLLRKRKRVDVASGKRALKSQATRLRTAERGHLGTTRAP